MMAMLIELKHKAANKLVTFMSSTPSLYYGMRRLTNRMDDFCTTADSEIVIEGYPRSANSSTVYEFIHRQGRDIRVAHHKHHAAQILRGVELGKPAVALIRPHRDAILSNLALGREALIREGESAMGRVNFLTLEDVTVSWLQFYRAILPLAATIVIAPFKEVTADISHMIEDINSRYGTSYIVKREDAAEKPKLGYHATPNKMRSDIIEELKRAYQNGVDTKASFKAMDDEATRLHAEILKASGRTV